MSSVPEPAEVPVVEFECEDFDPQRPGDRFIALSALREGQRIKADEEHEPDRQGHCHGFANGCGCRFCVPPKKGERELRRKLGLALTPDERKEAA